MKMAVRRWLCAGALFGSAMGAADGQAQVRPPVGDAVIHGRIYDSITNRWIPRTQLCIVYPVRWAGRQDAVRRCASPDTLGWYTLDSLPAGPAPLRVTCWGLGPFGQGKVLARLTPVLAPGERRQLDFPSTIEGCDPRPFRMIRDTFRGHYSVGFEQSDFEPCAGDSGFRLMDTTPPSRFAIWVEWSPDASGGAGWPAPERRDSAFANWRYYVEWSGVLEGPSHYGHLSVSSFQLTVDSVIEVRTPAPGDCGRDPP